MKNILVLIIILTCSSYTLSGQIYVGAKVGLAPSLLSFESQPNHKSKPVIFNPMVGVVVEIPVIFGFSVQPEVQFVTRGTNLKAIREGSKSKAIIDEGNYYSDYSEDNLAEPEQRDNGVADEKERYNLPNLYENIKIKLNYIEGQLMFKYEFIGGSSGLYLETGPFFSMGISSKGKSTVVDQKGKKTSDEQLINSDASITENYTDLLKSYDNDLQLDFKPFKDDRNEFKFKKSDMGIAVGAGLYKELNMGRLYFDARILWGLKNINGKENSSATIKSRSAQLSITYLFPLGG